MTVAILLENVLKAYTCNVSDMNIVDENDDTKAC